MWILSQRPCEICSKPTTSLKGKCTKCAKLGKRCLTCMDWTRQASGPLCGKCKAERKALLKGKTTKCPKCDKPKHPQYEVCYSCDRAGKVRCYCGWMIEKGMA